MSDEVKTTPTWGYHKSKSPQIFDLKDGESLPKSWADSPAAFEKAETEAEPEPTVEPVKVADDVQNAG